MCRVSVIIPTYNRARMLRQAIHSVLAQTYDDFELIVVDDGSTDDTRETVASIADPRVRYIWQENQERSVARNNGVREAQGEFVAFLDSDDAWLPHKLALQVSLMDRYPEVVLVYGSDVRMDDRNRLLTPMDLLGQGGEPEVRDWSDDLLRGCSLSSIALLLRRQAFERSEGFDPELSYAEDWDMWLRISELGPFCGVRIPVSAIRVHDSRSLNDAAKMLSGRLAVIDKTWARRKVDADPHIRALAELDVYASCAARGVLQGAAEASEWISEALARSPAVHDEDALRRAFVGFMASTARSRQDCEASARWLVSSVRLINSLGGSESQSVWLGSFWGAVVCTAYEIGDRRMAAQAFLRLLACGGIKAVDRGIASRAVRAVLALARRPGARRKLLPMESDIAVFLARLHDPNAVASTSEGLVEADTAGGRR